MLDQLSQRTDLPMQRTFTPKEYELIKQGFYPQGRGVRWGIVFEDNWLAFFRIGGPIPIFLLLLAEEEGGGARIDRAYANRIANYYLGTDIEEEMREITFMIDRLLLQRPDAVLRKADGTPITGMYLFYLIGNV